jgi:hypothetical protein
MAYLGIALAAALLVAGMLLPFLPGRYDPLAMPLSAAATAMAFGGLLLVPVGAVWLARGGGVAIARAALIAATLVVAFAAILTAAVGSIAAAALLAAFSLFVMAGWWRRTGEPGAANAAVSRVLPMALVAVPLVGVGARATLLGPVAAWSRDRAIANAAGILADIERYRQRTGAYPVALNSLGSDYPVGVIGIERYGYEPNGTSFNLYFEAPSTDFATEEIVMYNPRGEGDFSSHDSDLLSLSPDDVRRQRGYFASHDLPQLGWRRFLFD